MKALLAAILFVSFGLGKGDIGFEVPLRISLANETYFIGGANENDCAVIYPGGAYHLERRRQEASHNFSNLIVYESRLSSGDLRALTRDLEVLSHIGLAEYQSPALPLTISTYHLMTVQLKTQGTAHTFGYLEWPNKEKAGSPNNSSEELKQNWRDAAVALRPLRSLAEGLLEGAGSSNVEQSKANFCGGEK